MSFFSYNLGRREYFFLVVHSIRTLELSMLDFGTILG